MSTRRRSTSRMRSSLPKCSQTARSTKTACWKTPRRFAYRFGRMAREKSCSGISRRDSSEGSVSSSSSFIGLALPTGRASRTDDPYLLALLAVHDEQHPSLGGEADGHETLGDDSVANQQVVEVEEDCHCFLERHAVLGRIRGRFVGVPFEVPERNRRHAPQS